MQLIWQLRDTRWLIQTDFFLCAESREPLADSKTSRHKCADAGFVRGGLQTLECCWCSRPSSAAEPGSSGGGSRPSSAAGLYTCVRLYTCNITLYIRALYTCVRLYTCNITLECCWYIYTRACQHTSAYVSIRQHTSRACVYILVI
jgi:hypothetical protein